jgi:Domain of unknown function (DUF4384)
MLSLSRRIGLNSAAFIAVLGVTFAVCGLAQGQTDTDEGTRAVRIIGTPPPSAADNPSPVLTPPSPDTASPPLLTPAEPAAPSPAPPVLSATAPSSTGNDTKPLPAPLTPALAPPTPAPAPPPTEVAPPAAPANAPSASPPASDVANVPNTPDLGVQPTQDIAALSGAIKVPNAAGLSMQILPGSDIAVGSQVSFQVSSKKAGYLILIDVDATGKLVQIYPNPMSLTAPSGIRENLNYLRPGKTLQIPDRQSPFARFEFVAAPPIGTAMVLALLSDHPVQLVDLPDVPSSLLRSTSMVDYLTKIANELRIPNAGGNNRLEEAHWSFDVKFYAIK